MCIMCFEYKFMPNRFGNVVKLQYKNYMVTGGIKKYFFSFGKLKISTMSNNSNVSKNFGCENNRYKRVYVMHI